jgi:hypothetical protein
MVCVCVFVCLRQWDRGVLLGETGGVSIRAALLEAGAVGSTSVSRRAIWAQTRY